MFDENAIGDVLEDEFTFTRSTPSFKLFPKLPLELRLKIWRLNFPEPRILKNLSIDSSGIWQGQRFSFHCQQPNTLFVNHESRKETLKWYRDLSSSLDTSGGPIYFSPARDALHLGSVYCFTEFLACVKYLAERTVQIVERLSHVRALILEGLFMDERYKRFLLHDHGMVRWPQFRDAEIYNQNWRWDGEGAELEGGILAKFHGLKKLYLVLGSWKDCLRDGATVEECKELFRRYFEIEKQKWPDCEIPEIVVILPGEVMIWPEESV
jgi:hypothetical protein